MSASGPGDDATLVRKIKPGQTVRVKPGQWLVEEQGEVHHARNAGTVPIVIYIATLLRTGEPAAIPDSRPASRRLPVTRRRVCDGRSDQVKSLTNGVR